MADVDVTTLPFFAALDPAGVQAVMKISRIEHHPRGATIFRAGEAANDVFILVTGKVKLTRRARRQPPPPPPLTGRVTVKDLRRRATKPTVRESLLWLMGPGEMFGELSLFDEGQRSTSAVTQTAAVVVRISGPELRGLVAQRHDVGTAMLKQLSTRLRRSDDRTAGFVMSDVPGRLAHTLVGLAERFGTKTPGGIAVDHDLTQAEIAQIVGASRESVNKALTDFEQRGLLTARSRTVTLHDLDKLRARID